MNDDTPVKSRETEEQRSSPRNVSGSNPFAEDPRLQAQYDLLGVLGSGGMGVIYKVRHRLLSQILVVKMIHSHLADESTVKRFLVEAKAASLLSHPGIIGIRELSVTDAGQPYIVMDYVEGRTLSEILKAEGTLSVGRFINIFSQVCSALHHAHKRSVLHRDIKPSNIMVVQDEDDESVRILDFGIAKVLNDTESGAANLTKTGDAMGSPAYMSPEQARGAKVDLRSDIYSLGCTMFEMLVGTPPFCGANTFETMYMQMHDDAPKMSDVSLGRPIQPALERLVAKTLAKEREDRYADMLELKHDLLQVDSVESNATQDTKDGVSNATVNERSSKNEADTEQRSKSRTKIVIGVGVTLLLVALAAGVYMQPHTVPKTKGLHSDFESLKWHEDTENPLRYHIEGAKKNGILKLSLETEIHDKDLAIIADEKDLHLKDLDLAELEISDEALKYLANQESLELLTLNGTNVQTLEPLRNKLPNLKDLDLATTILKPAAYSVITTFKNLTKLSITRTQATSGDLEVLANAPNLQVIDIAECPKISSKEALKFQREHPNILLLCGKEIPIWPAWSEVSSASTRGHAISRVEAELKKTDPKNQPRLYGDCSYLKALGLTLNNKHKEALTICASAITQLKRYAPTATQIANLYQVEASCYEALADFPKAIQARIDCAREARNAQATSAYEQHVLNETSSSNLYRLARLYYMTSDFPRAEQEVDEAIDQYKSMKSDYYTSMGYELRAEIRFKNKQFALAVNDIERAQNLLQPSKNEVEWSRLRQKKALFEKAAQEVHK